MNTQFPITEKATENRHITGGFTIMVEVTGFEPYIFIYLSIKQISLTNY